VGHSAGGHLVLCTAAGRSAGLAGALALAPVADLRLAEELNLGDGAVAAFLGPSASRADLDPRRMVTPAVPTAIIHGTEDAIVPLELSDSYVATHPSVRLMRAPGAGHFAVIDPLSAAWPMVLAEIERLGADPPLRGAISRSARP